MDHCPPEKRKSNPRERANIFSYFTFGYTLGLFKRGYRKDLEEPDIYEVLKQCTSKKCGDKTEIEFEKSTSIYKLMWRRFGRSLIIIGLIRFTWKEIFSIVQPYTMSRFITYFETGQTRISRNSAYYYAASVILLSVLNFIINHNIGMMEHTLKLKIQASLKSLLYRKALRLSPSSFSDTNLGNIVTILTKDIGSVEENAWQVMDLFIYIPQFLTSCYLLWSRLGNSAFIGIGLLLTVLPIQICLSHLLTKLRLKVEINSDERIQVTQEVLSTIKIIKMYTWEKFFNEKIDASRTKEVRLMVRVFYIHTLIVCLGILTAKVTFLVLILSYIWMGYTTNTELIFYVLSIFYQLTMSFGVFIPLNISKIAEFRAAFIRLNRLLQASELPQIQENLSGKPSVYLKGVTVHINGQDILNDVNLTIKDAGLTLVTGSVGSGKSSLLKTILQDYPRSKGDLEVNGSISYAAQDPWLFPSSIKQNILFGEKYDAKRYEEVTRICALNYDLSLLEKGDETVVADRGQNLSKGQQCRVNLARAVYRSCDIYLLDDSLTALDGHVQDFIFNECIKKFLSDKICVLVTQNISHLKQSNNIVVMDQGKVLTSETPQNIIPVKLNGVSKALQGKENNAIVSEIKEKAPVLQTEQQISKQHVYHEEKKVGKVELSVYTKYVHYGGGFIVFSSIIFLFVISQLCESSSDKLITQWIDLQQKVLDLRNNATINESYYQETVSKKDDTFGVYSILVILVAVLALVKYLALLWFCRNASINIHRAMSSRVVNAVMSFFDTHFIGNILNRFSLDLNNVDGGIPSTFPGLFGVFFSCIGSVVLIISVNWIFLIPASVLLIILFCIRMIYIQTGRSLKRLESATRSPLVGHINSSLEGLTTIRAFKAEHILKDEFDKHQDLYSSASFMRSCASSAFGFFMDFICSIFTILVIIKFLFFEDAVSAGNVGLALTQVLTLAHQIQWAMTQWAQLESNMTAVERALEYTEIKQETGSGGEVRNWPEDGSIRYENVSLNYESSKNPVLRNISFTVKPTQKIGVVGRTGAGKSSIISTLFRLYDYEGKILIDGVDINTLSLKFLRTNIAIIPQDPVLFSGTIRDNIDPKKKYSDEKIWKVLDRVKIKDLIPSLDFQVKENGSSFSSGQRQLICLARAAVGKHKIVVLDEATANMDTVTDKLLHDIIEDLFSHCTIITIAHRLHSIINCDLVMVLDSGKLVEFDDPKKLIEDQSSAFYKMCKESGNDA